jgi:tetratricopeptide (TPR) repeat protein
MINNLKYIFLALHLSFVLFGTSYSQVDTGDLEKNLKNASFKQKFETANSFMEDHLYEFATKIWLNLIEEQPTNSNINYKLGLCYLHSSLERNKALKHLLIAGENVSRKYDPFSSGETNAPFETHHYLGQAYHLNERFDEALAEYQHFKEEVNTKHTLFNKNEMYSIYSINAKIEVAAKKNFKITNIGIPINGEFSDFNPVITADQSAIFFTSRRLRRDSNQVSNEFIFSPQDGRHYEDVYVAYKNIKTGEWEEPELMDFSNPRSNQATISVSGDGQFLFIYKDNDGDGNIYVSEREGFDYGELKYLGGENSEVDINSPYWETHATLSADGKTLYFVSDRPGGLGGRDIYRSVKLPNNEWSKALNVGAPINSEYDEDSPFFHPDGKTLYFSSNGNKSMGGFDIFFSKKKVDGTWGIPFNIGYPLNTVGDDVYFSTTIDGKKGYYSSSHEGGLGREDIYSIKLDTTIIEHVSILRGYIDKGSEPELPAGITIWVTDLTEDGDPIKYKPNRRTGSYIFALVPCHEYVVEYMKGENTFHETDFTVPCNSDYHVIDKVITLGDLSLSDSNPDPDADTTITQNTIDNIEPISFQKFYGYNEKGVESEEERFKTFLSGIQSIIEQKGNVNIEVEGSASYVPTRTFGSNKKLSTYRSNEAKEMLMNKLKAAGVNLTKVKIVAINSVVQGPKYKGDFKDTEKYSKFQYIKLKAF